MNADAASASSTGMGLSITTPTSRRRRWDRTRSKTARFFGGSHVTPQSPPRRRSRCRPKAVEPWKSGSTPARKAAASAATGNSTERSCGNDADRPMGLPMTMAEWQPIETAPKGDEVLMVWPDGHIRIGQRYADMPNGFRSDLDFGDFHASMYAQHDYLPTHWMPLPAPPIGGEKE